jgi:hypothetical protein
MRIFYSLTATVCISCTCLAQAPPKWTRVSEPKNLTADGKAKELGVWKSPDSELWVQLRELPPVKTSQEVWSAVRGAVSGLSKAGQQPTSCDVSNTGEHLALKLRGNTTQDGRTYEIEAFVVFTQSHNYILKAFSTDTSANQFTISDWNLGEPIKGERQEFARTLSLIKTRLDANQSLTAPSATPDALSAADEDFASGKTATEADFRADLGVWTSMVDIEKTRAANRLKKFGENVDIDAELSPLLRRLANNRFFNLHREEFLHPGYARELSAIAKLRGENYPTTAAVYQFTYTLARLGIPLAILIFIISRWTRRVARNLPVAIGERRSAYYLKLLLKMSWRVGLLVVLANVIVLVLHLRNVYSDNELKKAAETTSFLTFVVLPVGALIAIWPKAKRRYAEAHLSSSVPS